MSEPQQSGSQTAADVAEGVQDALSVASRALTAVDNVAAAGPIKGIWAAIVLLYEIVKGGKALVGWINENKREAWFQESFEIHRALRTAKTPEEKRAVARRIRDSLAGLG